VNAILGYSKALKVVKMPPSPIVLTWPFRPHRHRFGCPPVAEAIFNSQAGLKSKIASGSLNARSLAKTSGGGC
jgi:hypothetical protein